MSATTSTQRRLHQKRLSADAGRAISSHGSSSRTDARTRALDNTKSSTGRSTYMRGVVMHPPGDVRVEEREDPKIIEPTDAIIRLAATCICGSDLWPYRGAEPVDPLPMGHEYVGVVEDVGSE